MSENIIWKVQLHLLQQLRLNSALQQDKLQIFHQVPRNTAFPYLYLGKFSVHNNSMKGLEAYSMANELQLYTQDCSLSKILQYCEDIKHSILQTPKSQDSIELSAIEFKAMDLDVMNDAKTYRVILKFQISFEVKNA